MVDIYFRPHYSRTWEKCEPPAGHALKHWWKQHAQRQLEGDQYQDSDGDYSSWYEYLVRDERFYAMAYYQGWYCQGEESGNGEITDICFGTLSEVKAYFGHDGIEPGLDPRRDWLILK